MKNNTRKILLALIVALTLLISMATVTVFAEDSAPVDDGTTTIYFENNWLWTDVRCFFWGDGVTCSEFPGEAMNNVGTRNSHELYSIDLPAGVTGLVISGVKDDGSGNRDQTPDITEGIADNAGWMMRWDNGNLVDSFTYDPANPDEGGSTGGSTGGGAGEYDSYTVAGVGTLCYSEWDVADTYNDMTLNEETGLYEKTFKGIPAGIYECKVAANHSWDVSWGGSSGEFGNYSFETFDEHDITITFDPATGTVGHTLAESTGPDEDRPVPEKPEIDVEDTITIYLANSANWETVYVYYWTLGSADQNANWPGQEMEWDDEKLLYYVEVPTYYVNIIFNNGNGVQTADLSIPGDGALFDNTTNMWSDLGSYTPPIPPEDITEDITVYVKDDAGWGGVYIYYWNVAGLEAFSFPGIPMELGEDGYYYATIPAGFCGVVFSNGGSWEDGSLLQTGDLNIPTDGKVYISNTALDNNGWFALGNNPGTPGGNEGEQGGNQGGNQGGDTPSVDQPAKEMTFLQKLALKLLLFLRSIEEMFSGIFKK